MLQPLHSEAKTNQAQIKKLEGEIKGLKDFIQTTQTELQSEALSA